MVSDEQVYWEIESLEWLTIETKKGPRLAFRGSLGGCGRLIVGDTREQLLEMADKMARGLA